MAPISSGPISTSTRTIPRRSRIWRTRFSSRMTTPPYSRGLPTHHIRFFVQDDWRPSRTADDERWACATTASSDPSTRTSIWTGSRFPFRSSSRRAAATPTTSDRARVCLRLRGRRADRPARRLRPLLRQHSDAGNQSNGATCSATTSGSPIPPIRIRSSAATRSSSRPRRRRTSDPRRTTSEPVLAPDQSRLYAAARGQPGGAYRRRLHEVHGDRQDDEYQSGHPVTRHPAVSAVGASSTRKLDFERRSTGDLRAAQKRLRRPLSVPRVLLAM